MPKMSNLSDTNASSLDKKMAAELQQCRVRLDELSRLTDGWDGDATYAVTGAAFAGANQFLGLQPQPGNHYWIFPTVQGGLLFEFEEGNWQLAVEFLTSGEVEFFGVEIPGGREVRSEGALLDVFREICVFRDGMSAGAALLNPDPGNSSGHA
jgi:hypothetical protein